MVGKEVQHARVSLKDRIDLAVERFETRVRAEARRDRSRNNKLAEKHRRQFWACSA
jgi:hypothetical protein